MKKKALLIGNSDGIGLAVTTKLLALDWNATGISRSQSSLDNPSYRHFIADVTEEKYIDLLGQILEEEQYFDLCIYFAGIGELLDLTDMRSESYVFRVNLLGMVDTATLVIPHMASRSDGHFIGISSLADELHSAEAPSYSASKAGFSNYLEGLALALRPKGVYVTNIRFGFVDTKMAKGSVKPFMISVDRAAANILHCIERKPIRHTVPRIAIPLIKLIGWLLKLRVLIH